MMRVCLTLTAIFIIVAILSISVLPFSRTALADNDPVWLTSGTNHNSRPFIIDIGDTWIMAYREAPDHQAGPDSFIHIVFSVDGGDNWTAEDTYIDGSNVGGFPVSGGEGASVTSPILIGAPNGDILCHIAKLADNSSGLLGTEQYRSLDGGATWASEGIINNDITLIGGQDYFVEGDTIYICVWVDPDGGYSPPWQTVLYRSTDNGQTWIYASDITGIEDNTSEAGIALLANGQIIAIMRDMNYTATYRRLSQTMGDSWNLTLTDISSTVGILQKPRMVMDGDRVLFAARQMIGHAPQGYNAVFYSDDDGMSWNTYYPDDTLYDDCGYSSLLVIGEDNYVLTSYAGTMFDADIILYSFNIPEAKPVSGPSPGGPTSNNDDGDSEGIFGGGGGEAVGAPISIQTTSNPDVFIVRRQVKGGYPGLTMQVVMDKKELDLLLAMEAIDYTLTVETFSDKYGLSSIAMARTLERFRANPNSGEFRPLTQREYEDLLILANREQAED